MTQRSHLELSHGKLPDFPTQLNTPRKVINHLDCVKDQDLAAMLPQLLREAADTMEEKRLDSLEVAQHLIAIQTLIYRCLCIIGIPDGSALDKPLHVLPLVSVGLC